MGCEAATKADGQLQQLLVTGMDVTAVQFWSSEAAETCEDRYCAVRGPIGCEPVNRSRDDGLPLAVPFW